MLISPSQTEATSGKRPICVSGESVDIVGGKQGLDCVSLPRIKAWGSGASLYILSGVSSSKPSDKSIWSISVTLVSSVTNTWSTESKVCTYIALG
jgi:hypothetical protein